MNDPLKGISPSASPSALMPLLATIADAAQHREPLAPRLRACGEIQLAEALDAGCDLPTALGARLPPRYRELLAGPRPGLEETALFVRDDLRQRQLARAQLISGLIHPLVTWAVLVAVAAILLVVQDQRLSAPWLAFAGGGTIAAVLTLIWRRDDHHAALTDRYLRAALASRWRLTEERLTALLGADLAELAPLLGTANAEVHFRRLAALHRRRADSLRHWRLVLTGTTLYIAGGALLIASVQGPLADTLATVIVLGEDGDVR